VGVGHNTTNKLQYPQYVKIVLHDKAIAWKRSKMSYLPEDKAAYKTIASKCSDAINKYHAAKELEMICKHFLGLLLPFLYSNYSPS